MFSVRMMGPETETISEMDYTELVELLDDNQVERINMEGRIVEGTLKDESKFTTVLPHEVRETFYEKYLEELVESGELRLSGSPDVVRPWYIEIFPTLLVLFAFAIFWFVFMQQSQEIGRAHV